MKYQYLFVLVASLLIGQFFRAFPQGPAPAPAPAPRTVVPAVHVLPLYISAYHQTGADPGSPDSPTSLFYFRPPASYIDRIQAFVQPLQHTDYIPEAWDCKSMAQEWSVLAQRWAVWATGGAPVRLAVWVTHVVIYPGAFDGRYLNQGGHALILLIDSDGVGWFIDAQSGWRVKAEEAYYEGWIEARKIQW